MSRALVLAVVALAPQGAPDPPARVVPQLALGQPVAVVEGAVGLRLDGVRRHVLQVCDPATGRLVREVEFADEVRGVAWDPAEALAYASTAAGVFRVDCASGDRVLLAEGVVGELDLHPSGRWVGAYGVVPLYAPEVLEELEGRMIRDVGDPVGVAVLDATNGDVLVRYPLARDHGGGIRWVDDRLHGGAMSGQGLMTRHGRGHVQWTLVALDPAEGLFEVLDSQVWNSRFEAGGGWFEPELPGETPAKGTPDPRGPGMTTRTALLVGADEVVHALSGAGVGAHHHAQARLTSDGAIRCDAMDPADAPLWLGPALTSTNGPTIPGLHDRFERAAVRLVTATAARPAFALVTDWEAGTLSLHDWDRDGGLGVARWTRDLPDATRRTEESRAVDATGRWLFLYAPTGEEEEDFWLVDLATGETLEAFGWPADLGKYPPDHVLGMAFDRGGRRVLVTTQQGVAALGLSTLAWSGVRPRSVSEARAFSAHDGWVVAGKETTVLVDADGAIVGELPIGPVTAVSLHGDGALARVMDQGGGGALVDIATGEVRERWAESERHFRGVPDAEFPASAWSPNGRSLLRAVGQAGRVRAVDLATGATTLEWLVAPLPDGGVGWLAWTPSGAWDGSPGLWASVGLVAPDGAVASGVEGAGRDPAAVRAAVAALFD